MGLLPAGGDSILWFSAEFFGSRMNSYSREAKQEDPSKNSFCGDVRSKNIVLIRNKKIILDRCWYPEF